MSFNRPSSSDLDTRTSAEQMLFLLKGLRGIDGEDPPRRQIRHGAEAEHGRERQQASGQKS
jgi:hypothetical protein